MAQPVNEQRRGSGGVDDGGLRMPVEGGTVVFTKYEVDVFNKLFDVVDANEDGVIEGAIAAAFFRRSGVPDGVLREVWRLACGGKSAPSLTREPWLLAMKLIALAQKTEPPSPSLQPLVAGAVVPLPTFGFDSLPDAQEDLPAKESQGTLTVRVLNPVVEGSGMFKHTLYETATVTTMPRFIYKEMRVARRFRDFVWLHKRLRTKYPAVVVPPLPEKKMVGNLEAGFVEERRQALEYYLSRVAAHPVLSLGLDLEIFLAASRVGIEAAQALSVSASHTADEPVQKFFSSAWDSVSNYFGKSDAVAKSKTDEEYAALTTELTVYENHMQRAVAAAESVVAAHRAWAFDLACVGTQVAETGLASLEPPGTPAFACFKAIGDGLEVSAKGHQDHSDKLVTHFLTPLRYQYGMAGASKAVLNNRTHLKTSLQQAGARHASAKKDYASARAAGGAGASAAEARVNDAKTDVQRTQETIERLEKQAKTEIANVKRERIRDFSVFLKAFAAQRLEAAKVDGARMKELIAQAQALRTPGVRLRDDLGAGFPGDDAAGAGASLGEGESVIGAEAAAAEEEIPR